MGQLFTQIDGLEIGPVFVVPILALPAVQLILTFGSAAGLLPSDLAGIRRKPMPTNFAGPLSRFYSLHRALSDRLFRSTIPCLDNWLGQAS